jgi:hypothetical protein
MQTPKLQIPNNMRQIMIFCLLATGTLFAQKSAANATKAQQQSGLETITLGGGCYWCVEAVYENLVGVQSVVSGFAGGKTADPTYEQVSSGNTVMPR